MQNWTQKNLQDKGIAQVNGTYQKLHADSLGKVRKPPIPNKKVMGARKTINVEGVKFDSQLEKMMYDLLKGAGINFEFQHEIVLQPKFKYGSELIRSIKSRVDFWLPGHQTIIDTKGHATDISKLKFKLLKFFFFSKNEQPKIYMPGTKNECICLIKKLKYDK